VRITVRRACNALFGQSCAFWVKRVSDLFIVVRLCLGEMLDLAIITSSVPPPKLLGEPSEVNVGAFIKRVG